MLAWCDFATDHLIEILDVIESERSVNSTQSYGHIVLRNCDATIATKFAKRSLEGLYTTSSSRQAMLHTFDHITSGCLARPAAQRSLQLLELHLLVLVLEAANLALSLHKSNKIIKAYQLLILISKCRKKFHEVTCFHTTDIVEH